MEDSVNNKEIFISYCHADNENQLGEGWIEQFHDVLRTRLKQILGARRPEEEPGIWRDKELQGNDEFAEVLLQKIHKVSIVVSIITPSYIASDWCQREINEFVKAASERGGLVVENQARIFKVLKTPVDRDKHPEPLRGQIGYEFYILDKDTGIPCEFTLLTGDNNNTLALQKINDLAYHIIHTLKALHQVKVANDPVNEQVEPKEPDVDSANKQLEPKGPAVYLAETSFDLDEEHNKIRRELEAWGYKVLPEGELPIRNPDQFRAAVHNALQQCSLAIHMIGAHRSVGVAGEADDTVRLQNRLAAEWSASKPLERLIWLPQELNPKEVEQQQFIELLQTDASAQTNAEILQVPRHELVAVIHDTLKRKSQAEKPKRTQPDRKLIYVSYAYEDNDAVNPLIDYLFETGYEVLEPLSDANMSDQQILEIHKRNLGDCDAVLLFTDSGGEFWLKIQLGELRRASAWRGNKPMLAEAIYRTPDAAAAAKRPVRTHYQLIEGSKPFSSVSLEPFLAQLDGAK